MCELRANECVSIRVCEYLWEGVCISGQSASIQEPSMLPVFALFSPDGGSRGRQRALRVSVLAYRTPWGKQVKAWAASPKEQPFRVSTKPVPSLAATQRACKKCPSHFQQFLPPLVSSKPTDIENPGREGRKFRQRKYRNYLLKEREGTSK